MKNRSELNALVDQVWNTTPAQPEPLDQRKTEALALDSLASVDLVDAEDQWLRNSMGDAALNYIPEEQKPGVFESLGIGALDNSYIGGAVKAFTSSDAPENTYADIENPTFDAISLIKANPEYAKVWEEMARDPDNPFNESMLKKIAEANNAEYLDYVFQRRKEQEEFLKNTDDAGMTAYIIGAALGIGADTVLAILATKGVTGGAAGGAGGARLTSTIAGARALGAAKTAPVFAAEGAVGTYVQMLTNDYMTADDILVGAGLGGVLGSALGAMLPRYIAGVHSEQAIRRAIETQNRFHVEEMMAAGRYSDDSVGAAKAADAVPGDFANIAMEVSEEATVSGRVLAKVRQKIANSDLTSLAAGRWLNFFRSPRSLSRGIVEKARRLKKEGLEGVPFLAAVTERVYRFSGTTGADQVGKARSLDFTTDVKLMHERLYAAEAQSRRNWRDMVVPVYGEQSLVQSATLEMTSDYLGEKIVGGLAKNVGDESKRQITHAEWASTADLYAQAIAEGDEIAAEEILKTLTDRVPPHAAEVLKQHLQKEADLWNGFYQKFGEDEVRVGAIAPEELRPGYRPQVWNPTAIRNNRTEFKLMLRSLLERNPDPEFVRPLLDDMAEELPEGAVRVEMWKIDEGETWAEFAAREPMAAELIAKEWDNVVRAQRAEALDAAEEKLARTLKEYSETSAADVLMRHEATMATLHTTIGNYHRRIANLERDIPTETDPLKKAGMENRLRKNYKYLAARQEEAAMKEAAMEPLARAYQDSVMAKAARDGDFDILDENSLAVRMMARRGQRTPKGIPDADAKKMRSLAAKMQKTAVRAAMLRAKKTFDDDIERMIDAMADARAYGGFLNTEQGQLIQNSRFFKRRALDLKGLRHRPEWRKFLSQDSFNHASAYTESTSRQIAMRRQFLPHLIREGVIDDISKESMDKLSELGGIDAIIRGHMRSKFEQDKLRFPERADEIDRMREEADEFLERMFGEMTQKDRMNHLSDKGAKNLHEAVAVGQTLSSAMSLGFIMLSTLSDMATMFSAGGRLRTGLGAFLRRTNPVIEELAQNDYELASFIAGGNIQTMARFNRILDIDATAGFDVPGGMFTKWRHAAQSIAQVEGYFNFMHIWNKHFRAAFGIDMGHMLAKDLEDWAGNVSQNPGLIKFYAKHGVGTDEAAKLARAMEKAHILVKGKKFPDFRTWKQKGWHDEVSMYQRLIKGAGDEAMQDPGIGDRPFLTRNLLGRMMLQFTSFAYTVGNNWLTPAIQDLAIGNAGDVGRVLGSFSVALSFAAIGERGRDLKRGEFGEDIADVEADFLYRTMMRTSFMLGMMGPALDIGTPFIGGHVNEAIGADVLPSQMQRFRFHGGVAGAMMGPTAGNLTGMVTTLHSLIAEGDTDEAWNFIKHRMPVANTIGPWLIMALIDNK